MRLLFLSAHWHGLAKLRLHTAITLGIMDRLTTELGQALREFEGKVCNAYVTRELPRETAARERKQKAQEAASQKETSLATMPQPSNDVDSKSKQQIRSLNLQTYKHHSLGDYVETIRQYGTTDSYNTETVCLLHCFWNRFLMFIIYQGELEHRTPKARYRRTDRKAFIKQLTQIERRQTRIYRIKRSVSEMNHKCSSNANQPREAAVDPGQHHHIGRNENIYNEIGTFLRDHADDPAIKVRDHYYTISAITELYIGIELSTKIEDAHPPPYYRHPAERLSHPLPVHSRTRSI